MSTRTQSAQQDPKRNESWCGIESLIYDVPAREHVSFAFSYRNVFHKANGRARHNVELFCLSKGLGSSSNSKQNTC